MKVEALFGGDPQRWVPFKGTSSLFISSMESADRKILIFANMVARVAMSSGWWLSPCDYRRISEVKPEGMFRDRWRPQLYTFHDGIWTRMGSQHELLWRWNEAGRSWQDADQRAKETLLDHLSEHQIAEYIFTQGDFTVIGGMTGNTYIVRLGNGFSLISSRTREELVSYCLHPEGWIPHDDVSLAIKLGLECPETEEATMARGKAYCRRSFLRSLYLTSGDREKAARYPRARKSTRIERYAADMETELLT